MLNKFVCNSQCNLPVTRQLDKIIVHGAKEHNLKNICFEIPKGKLVALTGPSGSGKSSIATDILQTECLRQFLESLGLTTDHLTKPNVDTIIGLSPSIGVTQRVSDINPRSTVGTKTGILTILRNLFATIGRQPCLGCGSLIKHPLQIESKYTRVEVSKKKKSYFSCPDCGYQIEKLKMAHFSFNALSGACQKCEGIGEVISVDLDNLLNEEKTIENGGVKIWDNGLSEYYAKVIKAASKHYNFSFDIELLIKKFTMEQKNFLLFGTDFPDFIATRQGFTEPKKVSEGKYEGIVNYLLRVYKNNTASFPSAFRKYIVHAQCPECQGSRLCRIGREVTICGKTITDVTRMNLTELLTWISNLEQQVSVDELEVVNTLSNALKDRTSNLIEVGLHYLTLDRTLPSLSGGESQRLRLAALLGSGLTGVLYVLDEPTTGLHPHDTTKLLKTLRMIQESGNTVLIIEHDLDVIKNVDHIIDVGPGGGRKGGEIVTTGTPKEVQGCEISTTGRFLAKDVKIGSSLSKSIVSKAVIVRGASENNLKNIDVSIPVNQFVVLTGVSGSGKSTFLFDILDK